MKKVINFIKTKMVAGFTKVKTATKKLYKKFSLGWTIAMTVAIIGLICLVEAEYKSESYAATVVQFEGWDELTLEKINGEVVKAKFKNIELLDVIGADETFNNVLTNASVQIKQYGTDKNGVALVKVSVDGIDFDEYATNNNIAAYKY